MQILHLHCSLNGDASFSRKLGDAIVSRLQDRHPLARVKGRDLAAESLPHFGQVHRDSFYTPVDAHTPELAQAARYSDEIIEEVNSADVIVIDTPMYNLTITSTLKSWIDHLTRVGVTFRYTESGPEGLIANKKVYLAISTGSIYAGGNEALDFTEPYLRTMLGYLGMRDLTAFRVEGTMVPGHAEVSMANAMATVADFSF